MKLLVRRAHTRKFYAGESGWTDDLEVALPFSSAAAACNEFPTHHNLELVVRSEIMGTDITIPLVALHGVTADPGGSQPIRI
jgi:hypothetical protein